MKPAKQRRATYADVETILAFHATKRFSVDEIAKEVKFSPSTVRYWIRKGRTAGKKKPSVDLKKVAARRRAAYALSQAVRTFRGRKRAAFGSVNAIRCEMARTKKICCSNSTVRRDLKSLGLESRVRPKTPVQDADKKKRLQFALISKHKSAAKFVFSDEKIFTSNDQTQRRQWVPRGKRPLPRESTRYPGARVMIWGAIGVGYRSLVILPKDIRMDRKAYVKRCLSRGVVKHCVDNGCYFMQDGASCHTAARKYLLRKGVNLVDSWPAHSPDLNPIETFWGILAPKVSNWAPRNREELIEAIEAEFANVPQATIDRLVRGFAHRVDEVVKRGTGEML